MQSCILDKGNYVKDLSVIDHDLSRIILVDNSPASYKLNPANGLPIEGFVDDASDEALLDLLPLLDSLRFTTVRLNECCDCADVDRTSVMY